MYAPLKFLPFSCKTYKLPVSEPIGSHTPRKSDGQFFKIVNNGDFFDSRFSQMNQWGNDVPHDWDFAGISF